MDIARLGIEFDSSPLVEGTRRLDAVAAAAKKVDPAFDSLGTAAERAFAKVDKGATAGQRSISMLEQLHREVRQTTQGLSPLAAGVDRLDSSVVRLNKDLGATPASLRSGATALNDHGKAVNLAAAANENLGKSAKQAANDLKVMQYQLIDVAQGLAMGQSPLMVALQQGGQIAQAGGIRGAIAAYRALPGFVRYGAPAAGVAAGAYSLLNSAQSEGLNIANAGLGAGARSGLTPLALEQLGRRGERFGLSAGQGVDIATGLARAGVGREGIEKAQGMALDLSASLRKDVGSISEMLQAGAADPGKFYESLSNQIGTYDARLRAAIDTTKQQGDATKAMGMALDGVASGGLTKWSEKATTSMRIGQGLSEVFSKAKYGLQDFLNDQTDASGTVAEKALSASEKLKRAEEQKQKAIDATTEKLRTQAEAIVVPAEIQIGLSRMDPLSQQVALAQRAAGGGPRLTAEEQKAYEGLPEAVKAQLALNDARLKGNVILQNTIDIGKSLTEQTRANTLALQAETAAVGKSAAEQARLTFAAQARIAAGQGGKQISAENEKQILKEADAYGKLVDALGRTRLEDQIRFDRSQIGRNQVDQGIASQLRGLGGIDDPRNAGMVRDLRANAEMQRVRQETIAALDEFRQGFRGAVTGVFSDIRQGRSVGESLANASGRMADQAFDRFVSKPLMDSLLGREGQPGGGLFGGWLDKGIQSLTTSTASMNVTAASVTIGGLGGLTGGIPGVGGVTGAATGGAGSGGLVGAAAKALGLGPVGGTPGDRGALAVTVNPRITDRSTLDDPGTDLGALAYKSALPSLGDFPR